MRWGLAACQPRPGPQPRRSGSGPAGVTASVRCGPMCWVREREGTGSVAVPRSGRPAVPGALHAMARRSGSVARHAVPARDRGCVGLLPSTSVLSHTVAGQPQLTRTAHGPVTGCPAEITVWQISGQGIEPKVPHTRLQPGGLAGNPPDCSRGTIPDWLHAGRSSPGPAVAGTGVASTRFPSGFRAWYSDPTADTESHQPSLR